MLFSSAAHAQSAGGALRGFFGETSYAQQTAADWQPEADRLVVDTEENVGYLLHPDGRFLRFRVVTGRRSVVRYLGRVYDARTPERHWAARTKETQNDRVTFDRDGVFLRLYVDGDERTPYGIHSHHAIDKMLSRDDRFKSMGCILVDRTIRSFLERAFDVSGGSLDVTTVYGIERWDSDFAAVVHDSEETLAQK